MTVSCQEYDPIMCLHFRWLIQKLYLHQKVNKNEVVMLVCFSIELWNRGLGPNLWLCNNPPTLLAKLWPMFIICGRSFVCWYLPIWLPSTMGYMVALDWGQCCLSALDLDKQQSRYWIITSSGMWYKFGKTSWFCVKQSPHKKLEYRVMNIFEALPWFEGPAEGGSPRYHPLRLGPKIVGKCSLPCRKKISKFETLQKWKVLS